MHSSNYHYRNLLRIGVKKAGQRFGPQETCAYQVKDGKIVSEQFFM